MLEEINNFKYLDTSLSKINHNYEEINKRVTLKNKILNQFGGIKRLWFVINNFLK